MSKSKWTDKPAYSPMCCGRESKWVCHTPTLHYFYCEQCKDEVDPIKGGKDVQYGPIKGVPANEEDLNEYLSSYTDYYPLPRPFPSSTSVERKFFYFKTEQDALVCREETKRVNKDKAYSFFICQLLNAPPDQKPENVWELSYTLNVS